MKIFTISQGKIKNDLEYKRMAKFAESFNFSNIEEADWILDYAQKRFELARKYVEYLDEKAESLIKYLGLGTAFFGLIFGLFKSKFVTLTKYAIIIGIILWIISVLIAIAVRTPWDMPYPPSVKRVFEYIKKEKESQKAKARLALNYGYSVVGQKIIGRFKARYLQISYYLLVSALILFLFSIFISFI